MLILNAPSSPLRTFLDEMKIDTLFPKMRRAQRELAPDDILPILQKASYGVLATYGLNGYPYGVPVNFVLVEDHIYFHCARDVGSKIENMRHHPKVCFTIVGSEAVIPKKFSTHYESVMVFGTVKEVLGEPKRRILRELIKKYAEEYTEAGEKYIQGAFDKTAIYEITIDHLTGKACKN